VLFELKELGLANPSSDLELEKLDIERTLGLLWDRERDSFIFKINKNIDEDWRPTRKQFLSVVLSVFDPLGFAAPVIFTMKVLMQKVCGSNVNFDEKVPEEFLPEFIKWCKNLHHLEEVSIPRSFTSSTRQVVSRQIHVFTDASNAGYGAVAYVRTATENGEVQISFVMAKTHVAPIKKKQTIPRLELLGAIEGLALAMVVTSELQENMKEVVFHTDSQIVLRWINSSTCKFEVFVENRIGKIVQETDRKQWRFVPGVDNPADMCSRDLQPHQLSDLETFHNGPAFLQREASEWP
jgi:ribonuclease HI